jgi:N-acetylglucosamine-6-phosphate deacetylase
MRIGGRDPGTGEPLAVTVEGGRIAAVERGDPGETLWLSPGLVDLQLNGFGGIDLNAGDAGRPPTADDVVRLAHAVAATGVTAFAPTLITASEASITAGLRAVAEARAGDARTAHMIPLVHVEGPHLSPEDGPRGAHPVEHIRPPDVAEFRRWQAACGGLVRLVTLSPHWADAPAYIAALAADGVTVALGHTNANGAEIRAAAEAGARLSTHLGNGAHAVLPRHPNVIWEQLAEDRLHASFIADGHHLPGSTLKAMLRAKSLERSLLVSDAVALAGMPPGIYDAPIGGRVELSADGRLGTVGTPFLAGAARPLHEDVAIAVAIAGLTLGEALMLATRNPGRFAGGRGALEVGAPADLIRFAWREGDRGLAFESIMIGGELL